MQPRDQDQQWKQPSSVQTGAPYATPSINAPQPTEPPAPVPYVPPVQAPPVATAAPAALVREPVVAQGVAPSPVAIQPAAPPLADSKPAELTPQPLPSVPPAQPTPAVPPETPTLTSPAVPEEIAAPVVQESENAEQGAEEPVSTSSTDGDETLLRWQASEYIQHDRTVVWYIILGVVTLVLTLVALFLIKSYTFAVLIPVMAVALFFYTRHAPAAMNYVLSKKGLYVNDKLYPYDGFKSFSVVTHAGHNSLQLIPRKRFQLGQIVYFPEDIGESLVDMLAARLPMKEARPDFYDKIISKLKM